MRHPWLLAGRPTFIESGAAQAAPYRMTDGTIVNSILKIYYGVDSAYSGNDLEPGAYLTSADLSSAKLDDADLTNACLYSADLDDVQYGTDATWYVSHKHRRFPESFGRRRLL